MQPTSGILRAWCLAFTAAAVAYVGVGVVWIAKNWGDVPHYGDTSEYLGLAQTLRVDEYRGFAYPLVLQLTGRAIGAPVPSAQFLWEAHVHGSSGRSAAPSWLTAVQAMQCVATSLALAYFICVAIGFAPRRDLRADKRKAAVSIALLGMVCLDSLVIHFNLAVMTDALTLAACLVFCGALASSVLPRRHLSIPLGVLGLAQILAGGLRPEKNVVLLATTASTAMVWLLWPRWFGGAASVRRRAFLVLGVSSIAFGLVFLGKTLSYRPSGRWPLLTSVLHHRVIFPHLTEVYAQLPPGVRSVMTQKDAIEYDTRIQNTRLVIDRLTKGDREQEERLTTEMASTVFRQHPVFLVLSVFSDTLENLLATPSFYARLAAWELAGEGERAFTVHFEATPWTYHILSQHHPGISRFYVALGALTFILALPAALIDLWQRMRARAWTRDPRILAVLSSSGSLCIVNAVAFASVASLVHIRYAMISHGLILVAVYGLALKQCSRCWGRP